MISLNIDEGKIFNESIQNFDFESSSPLLDLSEIEYKGKYIDKSKKTLFHQMRFYHKTAYGKQLKTLLKVMKQSLLNKGHHSLALHQFS